MSEMNTLEPTLWRGLVLLACILLLVTGGVYGVRAIGLNQISDFQDGTTQGWHEGPLSPNPPTAVADTGPKGKGDFCLENKASGLAEAGGKVVIMSDETWSGDYLSAGVTAIQADLENLGQTPLHMRVALWNNQGTMYISAAAFELPPDSRWQKAVWNLNEESLKRIDGQDTVEQVLSDVMGLRLLSSAEALTWTGDVVEATLRVDNIQASAPSSVPPILPALLAGGVIAIAAGAAMRWLGQRKNKPNI